MEFLLTEKEIRSRLGVSTLGIKLAEKEMLGEKHFALIHSLGIAKLEMFWDGWDAHNKKEARQIALNAKNQGLEIVSVHGPSGKFSSAYDTGITEAERSEAIKEAIIMGEGALELGASILVCHFGTTDYSEQSIRELLDYFQGTPLILAGENVGKAVSSLKDSDYVKDFVSFAEKINSDRFGFVLDLGHARDSDGINPFTKKENAYNTVALCKQRLVHVHLHDCAKGRADDHYPPFDGDMQWVEIFKALQDIAYPGVFMFEVVYEKYDSHHAAKNVLEKVGSFPQDLMSRIV